MIIVILATGAYFLNLTRLIKKAFPLVLMVALLSYLSSCSEALSGRKEEGVIEFSTRAVDASHPLYGFAPDAATMKFKNEKFVIEMSTMGMFNYSIIGDNKEKTLAQTVKFMNIKQACIERGKEIETDNNNYRLQIEETGETKEIAGLKCHGLKVTRLDVPGESFEAWYTKELGTEDCNALTPYSSVKGMLLDYRIEKMGMEMHFLAKSYNPVKVPDAAFKIPASMKIIPKKEMQKFFDDLQ